MSATTAEQRPLVGVDLFCGAGGFSQGLKEAAADLDREVVWIAVNHWEPAIETHERNHPAAAQIHSPVEYLHPPTVIAETLADHPDWPTDDPDAVDPTVDILVAGPECTHFSNARGGKPVSDQKRMSAWQVLYWLEELQVEAFLIENVKEIRSWGPIEDGEPTRDGSIYDAWLNALEKLGYSVNSTVLNAADFGDPTSRERFFLAGRQTGAATFPTPTHSPPDATDGKPDHRPAAAIIDWSDPGTSIWSRDLTEPRVHTPPKDTTMQRIAEGIRRHCADALEPFADALEQLGRDEIRHLRSERAVPLRHADTVAAAVDVPFLVELPDPAAAAAQSSYLLGQQSNYRPWAVGERPVPTVTSGGKHQLCTAESFCLKYKNNSPSQPAGRPLDTVHANGNHYGLGTTEPVLLRQQDGAHPTAVSDRPVPTVATSGAHAVATPTTTRLTQPLIQPKNLPHRDHHSNPLYPVDSQPHHTLTADPRSSLVAPSVVRFSHGGRALDVDAPMPTIATERGGVFALSAPYLTPMYNPRPGQRPRTRPTDRPLMTVVASKPSPAGLATPLVRPFIDDCQGPAKPVDEPLNTKPGSDRFALCVPELWPWGLDVKYRMLQPTELQQAQGFPADYEIVGTKAETTKQIGNAVPVNLGRNLCKHLLTALDPDLSTYGGGIEADPDFDVPDYQEVASDD